MDKKIFNNTNIGSRSPGPAAYSVKTTIGKQATDPSIEKNPAYSILGRRITKNENFHSPGPKYNTSQITRTGKVRTPGGILGSRLPDESKKLTPSPMDYTIASTLMSGGTKMRQDVGLRRDKNIGPAPNAYCIPNSLDGRAARITDRFPMPVRSPTPGPGRYVIPHSDLYLPGRYKGGRSMGMKLKTPSKAPLPGPSDNNCHIEPIGRGNKNTSRTTFGIRRPDTEPVFAVPADNEDFC